MSPFGKWLRKYRIDNEITLREMAKRVDISAAYLSAVETGVKTPTRRLADSIIDLFALREEQANELIQAMELSGNEIKIGIGNKSRNHAEVASIFARNFGDLEEEKLRQIKEILEG